jgi:hypothetical protein
MRGCVLQAGAARLAACGCLLVGLLALAAGCARPRTSAVHVPVSGDVTYKGKKVTGGWITFSTKDGPSFGIQGKIDEQGHYNLNAPVGEVSITVDNLMLKNKQAGPQRRGVGRPGEDPDPIKGKYVPIPAKYRDIDSTTLSCTVTNTGPQEHNIELTD